MKKRRPEFLWMGCLIALMIVTITVPAWAKKPINTTWRGIALKGYDTVAYFTRGKAVKGEKYSNIIGKMPSGTLLMNSTRKCLKPIRKSMHPVTGDIELTPLRWGPPLISIR